MVRSSNVTRVVVRLYGICTTDLII
jgi:hypothetical protein